MEITSNLVRKRREVIGSSRTLNLVRKRKGISSQLPRISGGREFELQSSSENSKLYKEQGRISGIIVVENLE